MSSSSGVRLKKLRALSLEEKNQLQLLFNLIKEDKQFIDNKCSSKTKQKKFEYFAVKLNELGPRKHDWIGWEKIWDQYCVSVRKKMEHNFTTRKPDETFDPKRHFTELENLVLDIYPQVASNQSPDDEIKPNPTEIDPGEKESIFIEVESDEEVCSKIKQEPPESPPPSAQDYQEAMYSKIKNEPSSPDHEIFQEILEEQTLGQKKFQEKMANLMDDIKTSMSSIEEYIKKDAEQKEEILKLKKEKLKYYQKAEEQKRCDIKERLKLMTELVELEESCHTEVKMEIT